MLAFCVASPIIERIHQVQIEVYRRKQGSGQIRAKIYAKLERIAVQ
jgi:hypothetical protein